MTAVNRELYEALKGANVPEEKALAAAAVVADTRDLKSDVKDMAVRLNKVGADLAVLRWMVSTNIALTLAVLWKLLK
jgi:hypothetical protein